MFVLQLVSLWFLCGNNVFSLNRVIGYDIEFQFPKEIGGILFIDNYSIDAIFHQ